MRAPYFCGMNYLLESEASPSLASGRSAENPAYRVAVTALLSVWAVVGLVTAVLVFALFVPGHLGLSDLLRALSNFFPTDFITYSA
jgi:hypothetical protein